MKRGVRWAIGLYLALLVLSHGVALLRPPPEVPAEMSVVTLPEFQSDGSRTGETVRLAFHDLPPAAPDTGEAPLPVVLLHGSPVASSFMEPFMKALSKEGDRRLLVPDLPGMGASTHAVADYSVTAHAHAVAALLERLEIPRAHFVGYSMGGGVAIELTRIRPELVASVDLLSALGVQEYELFGHYELNRSVHGLQWLLLAAVKWGVPHFGWFERQPLNLSYARNFLDTDQRPLRAALLAYDGPMLIQHGREDALVPVQAAREHARLVPQARLEYYPGGHGLVYFQPGTLVPDLRAFLARAEAGEAPHRAAAPADRRAAAREPFQRDRSWRYVGLAAVLVALLLMGATMASEDLTCIGAGFLVANGLVSLPLAVGACFLGIFTGDLLLYTAGRKLGRPALRRRPFRWVVSRAAERRAEAWFHRRGAVIIIISRFLPGTRAATYFTAGVVRAPFWKFLLFFGLAAALWTPFLVYLASKVGERMIAWYETYEFFALPALLLGVLLLYLLVEYGLPLFSWRGRRSLLGKWRRLTRWEYWPLWLVNAPVAGYVLWLVFVRYRRPTAFTLSNPAMLHGGFLGESKSEILAAFPPDADFMLPWALCPAGETLARRRARLEAFQQRLPQAWPVVIKPDEGQRGLAVHIVRDPAASEEPLARTDVAWILQAHAPGEEYGIFYYRFPGAERGQVPSITTKLMTAVTGDGERTLETLILADDRAVDQAPRFLERFADRLEEVPEPGERVPLVDLGTHARGATFLDGRGLLTPPLADRIETIARSFDGFCFGRFDFRVPSVEDLQAGRNLKLLEVNGLTSEQTHIYAPGSSLREAWRTLGHSWHLAIRIGLAQERERGLQPSPVGSFLRSWWTHFWRQRRLRGG